MANTFDAATMHEKISTILLGHVCYYTYFKVLHLQSLYVLIHLVYLLTLNYIMGSYIVLCIILLSHCRTRWFPLHEKLEEDQYTQRESQIKN